MPAYGSQLDDEKLKKSGLSAQGEQSLISNMPGDQAQDAPEAPRPQYLGWAAEGAPQGSIAQMPTLPSYDKGGDVPADQTAKLHEGERVLNPVETHAYKSAAIGNAPPTFLGRVSDRAHEIYEQGKQAVSKLASYPTGTSNEEVSAIADKQKQVEALKAQGEAQNAPPATQLRPLSPPVAADRISPGATYGSRPGEQRIDVSGMTKPLGAPQQAAPMGRLPSYDDGGTVPEDQVAKVHEDEHVLDPEKAAAYRQAEEEVKAEEKGAPADFAGQVISNPKGVKPMLDTEKESPDYKLQGARMSTDNAPAEKPKMDTSLGQPQAEIPMEQEAKTPLGPKVAPRDTQLNRLPTQVAPEPPKPAEVSAPDPMAIVQEDKMSAMKKGAAGLADLGTSLIHEKALGGKAVGPELVPETPEKPEKGFTPQEQRQSELDQLRQKMLYGATEKERFQAEKDLAELKRRTPWGSAENRPGIGGKIGHVLGRVGEAALMGTAPYALAAIPGSQMSLARTAERGEAGVEEAQAKEMKAAQIATEQQKPELKQAASELAEQKLENAQNALLRKQGLKVDAAGNQIPLTYEEMSLPEQGAYDLQQAKSNAQNSIAALKKAQSDPNSPQSQAILQKAKNDARRIDIAAGKLGIDSDKYKADYLGVDHDGNPLAGVQTTEAGAPIGPKIAGKAGEATAQRLNKADLSQNVQLNATNAIKMIKDNTELFGKVAGRYTNTRQMAGTEDEDIVRLGIAVHNMAVASAGIHGQRGQAAVEAYEKDILRAFHNSPEATIAGMNEISTSVQTFIDAAKSGKKVAPTPEEAKPSEKKPSAFEQWKSK